MIKRNIIVIGIIVVLVLLVIVSVFIKKPLEIAEEDKEVLPLSSGKRTYELTTDNPKTFQIIKVEIDPLDVEQGEGQQVTVWLEDAENKPITSENKVEGIAFTDNKEVSFSFKLKEVSDANGSNLSVWQGFWIFDDTYNKIYVIRINAKNADSEYSTDLSFK